MQTAAGVSHQVGEERRLALGQPDGELAASCLPGQQVESDACRLEGRLRSVAGLPEPRPDAGQELVEGERLGDVVGGAEVEALDPVGDLALRRQHDHRQCRLRAPDRCEDLDPVAAGKHPVEDDEVGVGAQGQALPADAVRGDRDPVALRFEPPRQEVGDPRLVLDDQDLHGDDATPTTTVDAAGLTLVPPRVEPPKTNPRRI